MNPSERLLITRTLPEPVLALARQHFAVTLWPHDRPIGEKMAAWAADVDAILVMANDPIDRGLLDRLHPRLRAIATYSVGHDHVDLVAADALGLPVFHTPDVLSDAVAEVAMLLILSASRNAHEAEEILRKRQWGPWSPTRFIGRQLTGRRLGIFGMGRIGQAIAARAGGFGLQIHYHKRTRLPQTVAWQYHETLESLLACSDVLCVAAPSTAQTRGILDRHRLARLPPGAVLVNIARGDLIDEDALIEAIQSGQIGAAGLDVFCNEPRINPRFLDLPRTTLLPHIGSATQEARVAMGKLAVEALVQWFQHRRLADNCLNPQTALAALLATTQAAP